MDKLAGVLLIVGLVIALFLGVFQGTLGGNIEQQGTDVGRELDAIDPTNTTVIGG